MNRSRGRSKKRISSRTELKNEELKKELKRFLPIINTFIIIVAFLLLFRFAHTQTSQAADIVDITTPAEPLKDVVVLEDNKIDITRSDIEIVSKQKKGLLRKEVGEVVIRPINSSIKEIVFEDMDLSSIDRVRIADVPAKDTFDRVYAIDPSQADFKKAEVKVIATGKSLYKCKDWDFEEQNCDGEWNKVQSITPGQEYSFTLDAYDPGFGESNNSLNIKDKDGRLVKIKEKVLKSKDKTKDLELTPQNPNKIKKIVIYDYDENETLGDLKLEENVSISKFSNTFSIDPTEVVFTNATIHLEAQGNTLFKCADWNFTTQTCPEREVTCYGAREDANCTVYGGWTKVMALTPGQEYNITLNATDPAYAEYNSTFGAPYCGNSGTSPCIINSSLLYCTGSGVEPNHPNTIDACAANTLSTCTDETVENITIASLNSSTFQPGNTIQVNWTGNCYDGSDKTGIYYTSNASNPSWTYKTVTDQTCPSSGKHSFTQTFALSNVNGTHAIRAVMRYPAVAECAASSYQDIDDVAFYVGATAANSAPTHTTPILNSTDGSNQTDQNLTCHNQSTADADNDAVKNIFNWNKNNKIFNTINMPFEGGSNSTWTRNYVPGINGTVYNGTLWNSTGGYDRKGAYKFDGVDDFISTGLSIEGIGTRTSRTITAWIKPTGAVASAANSYRGQGIVADASAYVGIYRINISGSDRIWVYNYDTNEDKIGITYNNDEWVHVAYVLGGGNLTAYKNGVLVSSIASGTTGAALPTIEIGRNGWASATDPYFEGMIDEVLTFNASLTAEQIKAIYENRTDLILSQETTLGDNWSCQVTPNDGTVDGTTLSSNSLSVMDTTAPSISFTAPTPANATTTENTRIEIDVSITEENLDKVIYDWNGTNYTTYNNNLILMYNFDNKSSLGENSTHIFDISSNGNNGTFILNNGTSSWTASGKHSGAWSFDGDGDYIDMGTFDDLDGVSNFTIMFWLYDTDTGAFDGHRGIFARGTSAQRTPWIWGNSGNEFLTMQFETASGAADCSVNSGTINDNEWTFITYTYNGSHCIVYKNGVLGNSDPTTGTAVSNTNGYNYIGLMLGFAYWQGSIDELRVWNRTMSAGEINQQYMTNLQKYNMTQWYLYVNQTKNSTAGLDEGTYTYYAYSADDNSNINQTETRTLTIAQIKPAIDFVSPTPANNTITTNTSIGINVSITEDSLNELIYNWNGTNYTMYDDSLVLMMNFNNVSALGENYDNNTLIYDASSHNNHGNHSSYVINISYDMDGGVLENEFLYVNISSVGEIGSYTIQSGDYLEYDVYWTSSGDYIALDYTLTNNTPFRQSGPTDQNGLAWWNAYPYGVNNWYHRKLALPSGHTGSTIKWFDIACEADDNANHTAYLDNIMITDGAGTVRKLIYNGAAPLSYSIHLQNNGSLRWIKNSTFTSLPNPNTGKYGSGLDFDGVDDYVSIGDIGVTQTQGTASVWVNLPDFVNYHGIFTSNDLGGNDAIRMEVSSNFCGTDRVYMYDTAMGCQAFDSFPTGTWIMLTAVWDSSNQMQGYTNGNMSFNATRNSTVTVNNFALGRGYRDLAGRYLNGTLDEFRVWNRSLTADEINQLYMTNLQKYNATQWYLYVNQSKNATAGLDDGTYTYYTYAIDDNSNSNQTETRTVIINTINDPPTHTTPKLNSTDGSNDTIQNLTCYNQTTADPDNDDVKNIFNWKKDGSSITVLNMPFEGGSNSTYTKDYSGYSNDGSVVDATWNSTGGYDGKGAYQFDGANDYVAVDKSISGLNFTSENFTIAAWFKSASNPSTNARIISKGANLDAGYEVFVNPSTGASAFRTYQSGTSQTTTSFASFPTLNTWYHIIVVREGSSVTIYADGVNQTNVQETHLDPDPADAYDLYIGQYTGVGTTYDFNGSIDDVMIFNYALTAEQARALYNNRTDLIVSQETTVDDVWQCQVTPNDRTVDGTTLSSNSLTIAPNRYGISLLYPTISILVAQNLFFNISINASCLGGDCGALNVTLGEFADSTPTSCNISGSASSTGVDCLGKNEDSTDATYDTCVDGTDDRWFQVDDIHINSTSVEPGSILNLTCTFCCYSSTSDYAIAYNNGTGWRNIQFGGCPGGSAETYCTSAGWRNVSTTITVDNVLGTHYARCIIWNVGGAPSAQTCAVASNADNDDISFEVVRGPLSTTPGDTPFYTNGSNPQTTSSLSSGQSENVIFWINATGDIGTNALYSARLTSDDDATLLNETGTADITIADLTNPSIEFVDPTPANATSTENTSIKINVSITEEFLDQVIYNWNGTNYTIFNDSVILFYNFDNRSSIGEDITTIVDISKSSFNGTWTGGQDADSGVNCADSAYGCSRMFDGVSDYINSGTVANLNANYTINVWIKPETRIDTYGRIISKWTTGLDYLLIVWDDNRLRFFMDTADIFVQSSSTLSFSTWQMWTAVHNGTDLLLYKNGQFDNSSSAPTSMTPSSDALFFGVYPPSSDQDYHGSLDEVMIINRTLTAEEINQLYFTNLQKHNPDQWYLYVNQTKNSTAGLDYGTYTYYTYAADDNSNSNQTETRTLTITDLTPAASITNLTNISYSVDWIYWNWTNPSDPDFDYNVIYIDGVWKQNTSNNFYNLTGLIINTNYTITVHTVDTSGNINDTDVNNTAWTNRAPTHTTPILNSTDGSNNTNQNLTCYNQSIADADNDPVKNIFNWNKNNHPLITFNMPFEGGSNDTWTRDVSVFGKNGSISGAVTWNATAGHDGKGAYQFNGTGGYITFTSMELELITIEAWVKADSKGNGNFPRIVDLPGYNLYFINNSGSGFYEAVEFLASKDGSGGYWQTGDYTAMMNSTWYHIVVVYNSTSDTNDPQIYINGVNQTITEDITPSGNQTSSAGTAYIGDIGPAFSQSWDGVIDEVRIYNTTLTAQQVQSLYEGKTNTIVSQETSVGDNWSCQVTPNDGYQYGTTLSSNNLTVLVDLSTIYPYIAFTDPTDTSGSTVNRQYILASVIATDSEAGLKNITTYLYNSSHALVSSNTTNTSPQYTNFSALPEGLYYFNATACNNADNCNNTETRNVTVDTHTPVATLIIPVNGVTDTDGTVTFRCSGTDDSNLKNITLYLWNSSGGIYTTNTTLISGTYNVTDWILTNIPDDTYRWNCLAYDNESYSDWSTNRTLTVGEGTCNAATNDLSTYSGYTQFFIPCDVDVLWDIYDDIDNHPAFDPASGFHMINSVTALLGNTTVYYDHWEDGYDFDPNNLSTADETYSLGAGGVQKFESSNVTVKPRGTATFYDCRDRIYVAGGSVAVTHANWPESTGATLSLAFEIFPTSALSTDYLLPIGQDLANAPYNYLDFSRTYLMVQATQDNTSVIIDDPNSPGYQVNTVLNMGNVTTLYYFNKSTTVSTDKPVNTYFIAGEPDLSFEVRGFAGLPQDLWNGEYYCPVSGAAAANGNTNLYIFNGQDVTITIIYEDKNGTGRFNLTSKQTISYYNATGRYVPLNSGVYLTEEYDREFRVIGAAGTQSPNYEWGFSVMPAYLLTRNYILGWAPGSSETIPTVSGSPVYVTPVESDTRIYVDYSPRDGVADVSYLLDRLDSQKIFDPDFDNTGMRIWTQDAKKYAVAWGEDPDTAGTSLPYLDLGYSIRPLPAQWLDLVLGIESTVNPIAVGMTAGQIVNISMKIETYNYSVDDVVAYATLPTNWSYVNNSASIYFSNGTTISGASANPTVSGGNLTWQLNADMSSCDSIIINFSMNSTVAGMTGYHWIDTKAVGTRLNSTQVFSPEGNVYVFVPFVLIDKDTTTPLVQSGSTANYVVVLSNEQNTSLTYVNVSDTLPAGFTFKNATITENNSVRGNPTNPSVGSANLFWGYWNISEYGSVTISFWVNVNSTTQSGVYDNTVYSSSREAGTIDDIGTVSQDDNTPAGQDPEDDEDITVASVPTVTLNAPAAGAMIGVSSASNLTFNCSAIIYGNLQNISLYITNSSNKSFSYNQTTAVSGLSNSTAWNLNLAQGNYTWNCIAYGSFGGSAWGTNRSLFVDTTYPLIQFVNPTTATGNYSQNHILANVTATDTNLKNITIYLYNSSGSLINSTTGTTSPGYINFTNLPQGTYYINATAYDNASNMNSTETRTITLDTTKPTITLNSPTNNYNSSSSTINFNWTATNGLDPTLSCNLTIDGTTNASNIAAPSSVATNYTLSGIADGLHNWSITCVDDSGNVNTSETRSFSVDTVKPSVTLNYPGNNHNTSSTSINFNWTATNGIDTLLSCNLTIDGTTNASNIASPNGTAVNLTVTGFNDGNHNWNVTCLDDAGNVNTSVTRIFTIDTLSPALQFVTPTTATGNYSQNYIFANVTATDTNLKNITIYLYNSSGSLVNSTTTSTSPDYINFTNLLDGTYYLNATACDYTGNCNSTETRTITILESVPPTFNLTTPDGNTYNQTNTVPITACVSENATITANITWDSTSQLATLIYNGTQWCYTYNFTNTTLLGVYNITFNATDIYNNSNTTTTNFTIQDVTPPAVEIITPPDQANYTQNTIINISVNVTDHYYDNMGTVQANITWDSTNQLINLTYNTTTGLWTGPFTNTTLAGYYNITIIATDNDSNVNNTEYVTIQITDITIPVINSVDTTPDPNDAGNNEYLYANVTDNVAVNAVWVVLSMGTANTSDDTTVYLTFNATSGLWETNYTLDTYARAGLWNATYYANDSASNNATPYYDNFTVNAFILLSLTQIPINFTSVQPGETKNATPGQGFPANVTNEGNIAVDIQISGGNLTGQLNSSYVIDVSRVKWDTNPSMLTSFPLSTTYETVDTNLGILQSLLVYFQLLTPPNNIMVQDYQGQLCFNATQS